MDRKYPARPIPAVGAIVIHQGRILLVKRATPPGRGTWSIPGGALRLAETLEDAVKRELLEETGLIVRPLKVVDVVERIFKRGERIQYHYVIVDYACTVEGGVLRAASDAEEARWFAPEELATLGLQQDTLRVIDKARGVLLDSEGLGE